MFQLLDEEGKTHDLRPHVLDDGIHGEVDGAAAESGTDDEDAFAGVEIFARGKKAVIGIHDDYAETEIVGEGGGKCRIPGRTDDLGDGLVQGSELLDHAVDGDLESFFDRRREGSCP